MPDLPPESTQSELAAKRGNSLCWAAVVALLAAAMLGWWSSTGYGGLVSCGRWGLACLVYAVLWVVGGLAVSTVLCWWGVALLPKGPAKVVWTVLAVLLSLCGVGMLFTTFSFS